MYPSAEIAFNNGSLIRQGTIDAGLGGNNGIALVCSIGYELKWDAGRLFLIDQSGNIRHALFMGVEPGATYDSTLGYIVGSKWSLDNGRRFVCTDDTATAAVWVEEFYNSNATILTLSQSSSTIAVVLPATANRILSYGDITLTGDWTLGEPSGSFVDGQRVTFRIKQDATGGRVLSLAPGYIDPLDQMTSNFSIVANKKTYIATSYDADSDGWFVTAVVGGF